MYHFVAQLLLEFVEIGLIGRVEFFTNVGKIDNVAVAEILVRTVDAC